VAAHVRLHSHTHAHVQHIDTHLLEDYFDIRVQQHRTHNKHPSHGNHHNSPKTHLQTPPHSKHDKHDYSPTHTHILTPPTCIPPAFPQHTQTTTHINIHNPVPTHKHLHTCNTPHSTHAHQTTTHPHICVWLVGVHVVLFFTPVPSRRRLASEMPVVVPCSTAFASAFCCVAF